MTPQDYIEKYVHAATPEQVLEQVRAAARNVDRCLEEWTRWYVAARAIGAIA